MILFLDTVSSLPEFSIIDDNKIIYSKKILQKKNDKMSDLLIPSYLELDKRYDLNSNLQLLVINTGPGSYTALRVGISFFTGLNISKKIKLIGITCIDLFKYIILDQEIKTVGIYIASSNNQNFLYFFDTDENKFKIKKIDNNFILEDKTNNPFIIKKLYTNELKSHTLKKIFNKIQIEEISFSNLVNNNIKKIQSISCDNNRIIKPIYFSNNIILN